MAETPPPPPPPPSPPPPPAPPPDARVPGAPAADAPAAGAPTTTEEAPPAPAARWVGETRTIRRLVEGPGGELVEMEVEHTPSEYVEGVPARDLSPEEFDALTDDQRRLVETCGLYAVGVAAPSAPEPQTGGTPAPAPPAAAAGQAHAGAEEGSDAGTGR